MVEYYILCLRYGLLSEQSCNNALPMVDEEELAYMKYNFCKSVECRVFLLFKFICIIGSQNNFKIILCYTFWPKH